MYIKVDKSILAYLLDLPEGIDVEHIHDEGDAAFIYAPNDGLPDGTYAAAYEIDTETGQPRFAGFEEVVSLG